MPVPDLRSVLIAWGLAQGDGPDLEIGDDAPLAEPLRAYHRFRQLLAFDPPAFSVSPPGDPVNGRYRSLKLVGEGGYGEVYQAIDQTLDRPVALKFLRGELGPAARSTFLQEARILAGLRHPHILTIHDVDIDTSSGRVFLALAWMPRGNLSGRLAEFYGHPERAARLVGRVSRGVQHAHAAGIVHRDLKPANILLGELDEVCVADFGIAKLFQPGGLRGDEGCTRAEATDGRGTPPYMAPEQFDSSVGPVGPWTDVWAIGCILYELLHAEKAFPGRTYEECASLVLGRPPTLNRSRLGHTRGLMRIVLRCLEKPPTARYPSATALADQLAAVCEPPRRRFVLGAAAFTAFAATSVWLGSHNPPTGELVPGTKDPESAFRNGATPRLAALERGEPVELIRPGAISPHLIRSGQGAVRVEFTADGFEVWSPGLALVDLLPNPPIPAYKIELEICHHSSELGPGTDAGAGIVFAGAVAGSPGVTDHFFGTVRVNEHDHPTIADVRLGAFWYRDMSLAGVGRERPVVKYYPSTESAIRFPAHPGMPRPSRQMTVFCLPDQTTATYQATPGKVLGPMTRVFLNEKFAQIDKERPSVGTRLRSVFRPVVGVYVRGGRAIFRSIRVIPAS